MISPDSMIHYVDDAHASARFYGKLLGIEPAYDAPVYASVPLGDGIRLAFWNRAAVLPPVGQAGPDGETCLEAETSDEVDATCSAWKADGMTILQEPVDLPFGRTFTAADADGNPIRVLCMSA